MNKKILGIAGILVILAGIYLYSSQAPGEYDKFAQCLTSKGISMGGTDWCHNCQEQKQMFGKSFRYVDYHNCDKERNWCNKQGVHAYPTWVFPDGGKLVGVQELRELAFASDCELNKEQ